MREDVRDKFRRLVADLIILPAVDLGTLAEMCIRASNFRVDKIIEVDLFLSAKEIIREGTGRWTVCRAEWRCYTVKLC